MKNIIIDSLYFQTWYQLSDLDQSTKKSYTTYLKKFGRYILRTGFDGDLLDFDKFHYYPKTGEYRPIDTLYIDDFIDHMRDQLSVHGLYLLICVLKSFFDFLEAMHLIKKSPMRYYDNPFYFRKIKDRSLSRQQCDKLLKAALNLDPFSKQFAVLILLEITCGLRIGELINLTRSQINFDLNVIYIDKGQKTRAMSVAMPHSIREALWDYLDHPYWKSWSNNLDKQVFFFNNQPLNYQVVRKIIDQICREANFRFSITPHQLRHTMARLMYEAGIHISVIQRQLRHKNVGTTLLYLPPSPELKKLLDKAAIAEDIKAINKIKLV